MAVTEKARQGKDHESLVVTRGKKRKYIVRRLTPLECCRLQGFPDGWGMPNQIDTLTPEQAKFWEGVREAHARVTGKKYKPMKDTTSLVKYVNGLHTDGAEYKMWGNGIALPCAAFVLGRITEHERRIGREAE